MSGDAWSSMSATTAAYLIRRCNRFVLEISLADHDDASREEQRTTASLPNPGRLTEILLPGAELRVVPGPPGGKHPWRVVGARTFAGDPVFLDTGRTNSIARVLLQRKCIPQLVGYSPSRAEVILPGTRSRVDFLLTPDGHSDAHSSRSTTPASRFLEVKSCTLFNGRFAMFPDAVTDRGRRHVQELADHGAGVILIVIHSARCDYFVPDFHTDPAFSRTLAAARDRLDIIPIGLEWRTNGAIGTVRTDISIPWNIIEPHLLDQGYYLVLLHIEEMELHIGALGGVKFKSGWYLYVGSARRGLQARISRHRRRGRKRKHWHIDYLREHSTWVEAFPIREPIEPARSREAEIARAFANTAEYGVPGFGSGDSPSKSHLFYYSRDPRYSRAFVGELMRQRRVSLEKHLEQNR